jgi:O-antigen/teichoic acid export membrane protein
VIKNIGANWIQTFLTIAVTYVLMPFTLRSLGQEQYGTWLLITAMTSYIGLLILGVPMASVRYIAKHAASGDLEAMNKAIASCAALYLVMGAVSIVVGLGLYTWFELSYTIPVALAREARWAFTLVIIYVASGFILQLPYGIMSAHQDFVLRNKVQIGSLLLRLGLTLGLLTWRPTIVWLAVIQIACLAFEFSVSWTLCKRRYPGIALRPHAFDRDTVRQILTFSVFVLLLQVGNQLVFQTDSLVIGKFMDVGQIPFFTVASSLAIYLMEFVISIAAVVMPTATQLETQGKMAELRELYLKWSKITLSLTLVPGLFLLVLGPRFIAWWIKAPGFEKSSGDVLFILMLANFIYLPVRGVSLPILMGLGKPSRPTVAFLVTGLLNLGLSIALAGPLGLNGVAIGTAIPNALFALAVMVLACRELGVSITEYVRYVFVRAALGCVPVLALLYWLRDRVGVRGFIPLLGSGVVMVAAFAATWVLFVYRGDKYEDLAGRARRILGRARP